MSACRDQFDCTCNSGATTSSDEPGRALTRVADVRVLGAIGVVELTTAVDMKAMTGQFVDAGVWVRPFGKLVYLMPPYIISRQELDLLTAAVTAIISGK